MTVATEEVHQHKQLKDTGVKPTLTSKIQKTAHDVYQSIHDTIIHPPTVETEPNLSVGEKIDTTIDRSQQKANTIYQKVQSTAAEKLDTSFKTLDDGINTTKHFIANTSQKANERIQAAVKVDDKPLKAKVQESIETTRNYLSGEGALTDYDLQKKRVETMIEKDVDTLNDILM
ncbi:hypothetical protein HK099_006942 [Clydaea vesicula]|uniref:Uncharacterized protein n=1 Tax=Clydaea vesicula TaxID=447962 RepID=A0AAD5TXI9_9FUNG|nr:hypothetical protein HK099_006942 [Clydaea vesicula]KAJ3385662.1 hypothetical protein HDU92_002934 [Lobulomyces angularis]